ncbi:TonB-dependent receptor domain-containing protein [Stenotrophomonas tumulicola]|uniref:TonB-dependent receptor n=1 Tax=Stenotrophomonas tumulicola TaxID=1685415 RepID=A0A7W3FK05_9GAMM|nr:TonB-dependent receptor [Stenotrophomonas tumulicola]MBA8680905.1 TonB-dependent receptor [Stenotrophomonas tumulicola]
MHPVHLPASAAGRPAVRNPLTLAVAAAVMAVLAAPSFASGARPTAELDRIVVTASASPVSLADAPASITVIDREELEKQPLVSISEVLSRVPGVSGGQGLNAEGQKIKLRGLPAEYSLILVDGRRIGNSSRVAFRTDLQRQDLDWLTPDIIERIEVVKGPMSSLYGSDAMGGVINIITKRIPDKWGGSATMNYKSPSDSDEGTTTQIGATLGGALTDSVSLRLSAGRTERQPDSNVTSEADSTTGTLSETVEGTLRWAVNEHHDIEVFGSVATQTNTNPRYAPGADAGEFWLGGEGEDDETENYRVGLAWNADFGWGNSTVSAYRTEYDKSTTTESNGVFSPTDQVSKQTVLDAKMTVPFTAGVPNTLTFGGQFQKNELTNTRTLGINSNGAPSIDGVDHSGQSSIKADSWAVFAEDTLDLTERWNLTLGARLDDDERYSTELSPRVYSVFHFNDTWSLRGGVATAFRAPDLVQTAAEFSSGSRGNGCNSTFGAYDAVANPNGFRSSNNATGFVNCYTTGNPDLKPETSTSYELGFSYNTDRVDAGLTFFHTDFKDKIISQAHSRIASDAIAPEFQSRYPYGVWYVTTVNVQDAVTQGLEGSFNARLTDALEWKNAATYIRKSENKDTGAALIETPKLSWYTALEATVREALVLELNAQYVGTQYTTSTDTAPGSYLSPYWLMGLNANYRLNENVTLRAGISNLLDEDVEAADSGSDYYTLEGRAVFVGLTARF